MNVKNAIWICLVLVGFFLVTITQSVNAEYVQDGKESLWHKSNKDEILSISISGNGQYITTTNQNGELSLFSVDSESELWRFHGKSGHFTAKICENGEFIVAKKGRTLYYLSRDSNSTLWYLKLDQEINSYSICNDGRFVLVATGENASLISGSNGEIIRTYNIGTSMHGKAEISGDGNYFIATDGEMFHFQSSEIFFYSTSNSTLFWKDSIRGGYLDVSISRKGETILFTQGYWTSGGIGGKTEGYYGSAYLYSKNGTQLWTKNVNAVTSWDMTEDGEYVIVAGKDPEQLYFLNKSSGESIWTEPFDDYIGIATITDDANVIVAGSDDGIMKVYDKYGNRLWDRKIAAKKDGFFSDAIGDVKISGNGDIICVGTSEGELIIFDTKTPPNVNAGDDKKVSKGDKVSFIGTAADDSSTIVKYEWDFDGDGAYDHTSTELDSEVSYTYKKKGEYTVSFKATNENGAASIDTLVVKVNEKKGESTPGFEFLISIIAFITMIGLLNWRKRRLC